MKPRAANRSKTDSAAQLYERYGKPLENEHRGKFVVIAPDGRTVVAPTLGEAAQRGVEVLGRGHWVFKIGEEGGITGRWR